MRGWTRLVIGACNIIDKGIEDRQELMSMVFSFAVDTYVELNVVQNIQVRTARGGLDTW